MPRTRLFFIVDDRRPARAGRDRDVVEAERPRVARAVSVPPKRTPPYIAKRGCRASVRWRSVRKFLSQRTVMPYSETPPKPSERRARRARAQSSDAVADRRGCRRRRAPVHAAGQRLDLQPVDADDAEAFVHAGGARACSRPGRGRRRARSCRCRAARTGRVDVERVPAREQAVDLDAPRQRRARR